MSTPEQSSPSLEQALQLMDAAVPGIFRDSRQAWRAHVESLRYLVISCSTDLSVEQLKVIQGFSHLFDGCSAKNLVEIRRALSRSSVRLEAAPELIAKANLDALTAAGIGSQLVDLTSDDVRSRLRILDEWPPHEA